MYQAGTQGKGFPAPSAPDPQPPAPLASLEGSLPRCSLPGVPSTQHRSGVGGTCSHRRGAAPCPWKEGHSQGQRDFSASFLRMFPDLPDSKEIRQMVREAPSPAPALELRVLGKGPCRRVLFPPSPQGMESPGAALRARTDCSSVELGYCLFPRRGPLRVRGAWSCPQDNFSG